MLGLYQLKRAAVFLKCDIVKPFDGQRMTGVVAAFFQAAQQGIARLIEVAGQGRGGGVQGGSRGASCSS